MSNPDVARAVLAELETGGVAFDAAEPDHARRLLNLDRAAAEVLYLLVRAAHRTEVLEIGTSNGFSTIWLAMALNEPAEKGHLITIERMRSKQVAAMENVRRAGLEAVVEFRLGDAIDVVRTLDGPIDCVFFDADRIGAHHQLEALLPKLAADCLLIADNAQSHAAELHAYFEMLAARADFQSTMLPVGKGLHVAHRRAASVGDRPGQMPHRPPQQDDHPDQSHPVRG
ncbi:O-methyltransferase [Bradyrhizobium prioriisuperbiae]|uniref:O-methyltransferase n=1 Tax=Bradyrhizobium prioriisuperbiae TaxID=2854389 RepID=UPI0028EEA83F|nr:class I SAM-dependent methyltransferase [Bradyrhizobium prioritasuperba]